MNEFEFNYCLNRTNKILYLLDRPCDKISGICSRISTVASKIFVRFARLLNYIFGDHRWYDEAKARSIVQYYLQTFPEVKKTTTISIKIGDIINRLKTIPSGKNATYGDGLSLTKPKNSKVSTKKVETSKKTEEDPKKTAEANTPKKSKESQADTKCSKSELDVKSTDAAPKAEFESPFNFFKPKTGFVLLNPPPPIETVTSKPIQQLVQANVYEEQVDSKEISSHQFQLRKSGKQFDLRTMFNLHANEFGNGSKLEGVSTSYSAMESLHDYLVEWQEIHKHPLLDQFIKRLAFSLTLSKTFSKEHFVNVAQKKIQEAFNKKRILTS